MRNAITNERLNYLNNLKNALMNLKSLINIEPDAYIYDEFIYSLTFDDALDDEGSKIIKDIINEIFCGPSFTIKSVAMSIRAESGIMISDTEFFSNLVADIFGDDIAFAEILFRGKFLARKTKSTILPSEFLDDEHAEEYTHPEEIFNKIAELYKRCNEYRFDANKYFGIDAYPDPDGGDSRVRRIVNSSLKAISVASGPMLNYIFNFDDPKDILKYLRSNIFVKISHSKSHITKEVYRKGYSNLSKLLRETSDKNDIIDIVKYLPSEKSIVANIFFNTTGVTKDPDISKILRSIEYKSEIAGTFHELINDTGITDAQCISAAYLMLDVFYDMRKRGSTFSKHKFLKNFIEMSIGGYTDRVNTDNLDRYIERVAVPILSENLALFDEVIINKLYSKRSSWRYNPASFVLRVLIEIVCKTDDVNLVKHIFTNFIFNRTLLLDMEAAREVIGKYDAHVDNNTYAVARLFSMLIDKFPDHAEYFTLNAIHHSYVSSLILRNNRKMSSFLDSFSTLIGLSREDLLIKYRGMGDLYKKYMSADELTAFNILIIYEIGLAVRTFSRERNCPIILSNIIKNKPEFDTALYDRTMGIINKVLFAPGSDMDMLSYIPSEIFECFNLRDVDDVSEIIPYKEDSYYSHIGKIKDGFNSLYKPVFNVRESESINVSTIFYGILTMKSLIPHESANRIVNEIFDNYTLEKYDAFKAKIPTYIFESPASTPLNASAFLTFRHYSVDFMSLFKNAYHKNVEDILRSRVASDIIDLLFSVLKTILVPYDVSPEVFTNIDDARDTSQFLLM